MTYWQLERPSKRSGKKWQVRVPTSSGRGVTVAFGDAKMSDYTLHKDKARRERYRTRHQRDRIDDPYAPGFWSWWSLWGESSDLKKAHAAAVKRAKKILGVKTDEEGNEVATKSPRKNPNPPGTPSPTLAEASEVVAALNVPKNLRAEFLKGLAVEWEHAHTVGYDLIVVGGIVLDHLAESPHYYRKLRRARLNPADERAPSQRVQACFDALLSSVQEQYPSLRCTIEVDESAGERGGHACNRAYAFCEDLDDGAFRIAVAHKLNDADDSRVEGLLRHELAHAVLLHTGDLEHTERDADDVAEALFGSPLFYDEEDVQTTDQSAPGARRPRPDYLDDANGRTLDSPDPTLYDHDRHDHRAQRNPMHQLHTVEDVASCLDDCAAQGDAKTPRMLASQLSSKSKELAGAQARMMLSLAKAARHCADAIEHRMAGEIDRAMTCERMCDRALAEAQSGRGNPAWAKKLGSGLYRGARYAGETARDLYHGAREAHRAAGERKNPRHAAGSTHTHRLSGIGTLTVKPDPEGGRDIARVEVTKAFASEWDYGLANQGYLSRDVVEAVEKYRHGSNFSSIELMYGGREFTRLYAAPSERKNPASGTHRQRLPGIGTLTVKPDPEGGRDVARVEVTREFASEWDASMANQGYLSRDVVEAVEKYRHGSNFSSIELMYGGREFTRLYSSGAGI